MPPRFSFLPHLFLAPHGIFLGGRSCFFWPENMLKFEISAGKSLRISAKTFFFFFGDHLSFWPENLRFWPEIAFGFQSEKAFGFRRKPLTP